MSAFYSMLGWLHKKMVFGHRVEVLASELAAQIPKGASILDIGCGSGHIGFLVAQKAKRVSITGIEVAARPDCMIPCSEFDGRTIPIEDASFDVCMLVDVLHHAGDPRLLLREAARVSKRYVLIKDHISEGSLDNLTLKFLDWVGNRPHGVVLPYNYMSLAEWDGAFEEASLKRLSWSREVPLYPFPASLLFGRGLHFVAVLEKA
jgi:SAM-dependent methyltransferase